MVIDKYRNYLGFGKALMSFEEAKRSPGRIAIKIQYPLYDVPNYSTLKHYNRGDFSVLTLPRIFGVKALNPTPKAKYVAVIQDNGETLSYIAELMDDSGELLVFARNENHLKAIRETLKRTQIENIHIQFETAPLDRFLKRFRGKGTFNGLYLEPQCSKTGMRPQFFSEIEEKEILVFSRNQFQRLRSSVLALKNNADIVYVTHSLDPTENQEVIVAAFRQGFLNPAPINDKIMNELKKFEKEPVHALLEIPTATQADSVDLQQLLTQPDYSHTWMEIDPEHNQSDAGFIAKLKVISNRPKS